MPHGVSAPFLDVLDAERRTAVRRLVVAVLVGVGLGGAAALLDGVALVLFAAGLVLGGLAGGLWQRRRTAALEVRLQDAWSSWMKAAFRSSSVREVADAAAGRLVRPTRWDILFVAIALVLFEVAALVVASFADAEPTHMALFAVGNGGLVGWALAVLVVRRMWAGRLRADLDEMVTDGELAVWGMK